MNCAFIFVEDGKPFCIAEQNQGCRLESGYTGLLCPYVVVQSGERNKGREWSGDSEMRGIKEEEK